MFYTIEKDTKAEIVEKKSKFIANLFQIESREDAEKIIKEIKKKYYDARHNCYAYIAFDEEQKIIEKCSDDGEPSGTAGSPMLAILKGNNLCNVLVIVTRYFGGILLGTGGLVRAYQEATEKALEKATYLTLERGVEAKIILSYPEVEGFRYYAKKNNINIINEEYSNNVEFLIEISKEMLDKIFQDIDNFTIKMTKIDILREKTIKTNTTVQSATRKI